MAQKVASSPLFSYLKLSSARYWGYPLFRAQQEIKQNGGFLESRNKEALSLREIWSLVLRNSL